ncbi:UNVERIFIED_CONTAM: Glutathione S-transferase [Sesamum angustifolium]|uniref:glutathione transferase n=1 Tax=Sesamum angustifolium TaxID=2727405 RepID=A0AAW2KGK2_9LAMI
MISTTSSLVWLCVCAGAANFGQLVLCSFSGTSESRAITKYISHAYADKETPLMAEDPKKQAIIGVWLEVEAHKFDAAGQKLSYEILTKAFNDWSLFWWW